MQNIFKFIKELETFVSNVENNVSIKDNKIDRRFIDTIEELMKLDKDFNMENMDLTKHIVFQDNGEFYISEPLKIAINKKM